MSESVDMNPPLETRFECVTLYHPSDVGVIHAVPTQGTEEVWRVGTLAAPSVSVSEEVINGDTGYASFTAFASEYCYSAAVPINVTWTEV